MMSRAIATIPTASAKAIFNHVRSGVQDGPVEALLRVVEGLCAKIRDLDWDCIASKETGWISGWWSVFLSHMA